MSLRLSWIPVVVVAAPLFAGCDLISSWFQSDVDLPVTLTSPPQDFSVDEGVATAEGQACAAPGPSCDSMNAICSTKAGATCPDDGIPDEFPIQVQVGADTVNANQLMVDMGVAKATDLKIALPVDVGGALADQGVQTPGAIKHVNIVAVTMQWPENSLTFDAPPLDMWISVDGADIPEGDVDADQLIADGKVKQVGTIGIDTDGDGTFDVGQRANSTEDVPLEFIDGGQDLLTAAVTSAKFTVVTKVTDGFTMQLGTKDAGATGLKPGGKGKLALKADLSYTVSAADIVGGG